MRIGEFLVQQNLITEDQLKQALEAQLIFGGHLGTCLMERGFITERQLGKVLAELLGVGYAAPECFEKIEPGVIATLSEKLIENYRVIPFRIQDRTLDVAMVDPHNLPAPVELAFASGYKIRPWVAPESSILQAMEMYYGICRGVRYLSLSKDTDQPPDGATAAQALAAPAPATTAAAVVEAPVEPDALSAFSTELLRAETVDQVTDLTVAHGARTLERCMVMLVKFDRALPWQGRGWTCDRSKWNHLSFAVKSEPVFSLLNGEDLYRGPIPRQSAYVRFFSTLGLDVPEEAIILPTHLNDRLVALFYGDGGPDEKIVGEDNYYRRLVRKFGMALSIVEARRKLSAA